MTSSSTTRASSSLRKDARVARAPRLFRADIQALRAIAIATVVANHLWPERLTGGFIGVDVFFAISGFLITSHLLKELRSTGRIGFASFYARRVRRLLPAALLVLLVTIIAVWWLLPYPRWSDNVIQTIASAGYVENWTLAALSVDYMAHNSAASAVQHYWSLSVEEQFYLVWPLLLVAGSLLVQKFAKKMSLARRVAIIVGVVGLASLIASIVYTAAAPEQAYFVTFTRAWQFAAGALVAVVLTRALPTGLAFVAALLGYAGIIYAAVFFDSATPYPGSAALVPTLATCLIIWSGTARTTELPVIGKFTGLRPVRWVGEISYSLYLWHWPLIVIVPFLIGAELNNRTKLAVLAAALVLAWLTQRFVEAPAQAARWWRAPRMSFAMMAAMMAIVMGAALLVGAAGNAKLAAQSDVVATGDCVGPVALTSASGCNPSEAVVDPIVPQEDAYFSLAPECGDYVADLAMDDRQTTRICDFSAGAENAKQVWLVGDSHAEQWQAPIFALAREGGWHLTISTFAGCPVADVAFTGFVSGWGPGDYNRCRDWAVGVTDRITTDAPDLVFTSMAARQALVDDGTGRDHDIQFVEGLRATWSQWTQGGSAVVPILDIPLNGSVRGIDCLLLNSNKPAICAVARNMALPADPLALAVAEPLDGVTPIDLRDRFCSDELCFAAVGGVPVYFDADHMSKTYAELLLPYFTEQIAPVLNAGT